MIVTEGVRAKLQARSLVNAALRDLLTQRGFLEVETPVLEATCGGADARPFVTYHNALGRSYTLRIATCASLSWRCTSTCMYRTSHGSSRCLQSLLLCARPRQGLCKVRLDLTQLGHLPRP